MDAMIRPRLPLGWKLAFFIPMAIALVLILFSQNETDLHRKIGLTIVANIFGVVSLISHSVYWIVAKKRTALGISLLIFMSAVLGFGLNVLLRLR